jgi:hypothetical protein
MNRERHFIELDEQAVLKLPFFGPQGRRIYVTYGKCDMTETEELFVQRPDAFATDLIALMNRLRKGEISEIRYQCGFDGFLRIFVSEKGMLLGEYTSESMKSLDALRHKLKIS